MAPFYRICPRHLRQMGRLTRVPHFNADDFDTKSTDELIGQVAKSSCVLGASVARSVDQKMLLLYLCFPCSNALIEPTSTLLPT